MNFSLRPFLVPLAALAVTRAFAQDPTGGSDEALELFALESQLEQSVVSSTKLAQRSAQTPSVITVVTREEIDQRGYSTLAEILRAVPGFYDVYDLVQHNVGVRGVNGGARAGGNVLKVMIDGHPVDYRPDTSNFFGPELIPVVAIERVEIIRGPASALYGANAFLGVVNVILRTGAIHPGASVSVRGSLVRGNPGGGGELALGMVGNDASLLIAAAGFVEDRSGLRPPSTSPLAISGDLAERGVSRSDLSRPRSLVGKARVGAIAGGEITMLATVQLLDAASEFGDIAPLTHASRQTRFNQNYRLSWTRPLSLTLDLDVAAHYFLAGPTSAERLDLGREDYRLIRTLGAEGFGASQELRWRPWSSLHVVQGIDLVFESHTLQSFDRQLLAPILAADGSTLVPTGTVLPGLGRGEKRGLQNLAAFIQAVYQLTPSFSVVAGARADLHNIYGLNPSARAGLVYAPEDRPISLKLLYGSSFKAPSAIQLYTQPMGILDVRGNPNLRAQAAQTLELAGAYAVGSFAEVSANAFLTHIAGRVEFVQRGLFLEAQNLVDEWVAGGELDVRMVLFDALQLNLAGSISREVARTSQLALGGLEIVNPLFPLAQAHLIGGYRLPFGIRAGVELSYISPRAASASNSLARGAAYQLPGYLFTALSATSQPRRLIGLGETSFQLRVTNVLNGGWSDPGFGGLDLPAQGRTVQLGVSQTL